MKILCRGAMRWETAEGNCYWFRCLSCGQVECVPFGSSPSYCIRYVDVPEPERAQEAVKEAGV